MQGIARLKCHNAVPAFLCQEGSDFARAEDVLSKMWIFGLGQYLNFAAYEMGFVGIALQDHIGSRVICAVR